MGRRSSSCRVSIGRSMSASQCRPRRITANSSPPSLRHRVVGPEGVAQHVGQALEQGVARVVAQRVVDVLEVIDVDHDQAEHLAQQLRRADRLLEPVLEQGAVGQVGQGVLEGQGLDRLGLAAAVGDVLEQIDQPLGPAIGPDQHLAGRAHPGLDRRRRGRGGTRRHPVSPGLRAATRAATRSRSSWMDDLQRVGLEPAPLLQIRRRPREHHFAGCSGRIRAPAGHPAPAPCAGAAGRARPAGWPAHSR